MSSFMLAKTWDESIDPTGWWMSEKLDGVRAMWDGHNFTSRLGNTFNAPDYFKKGVPFYPLDGELWTRRGDFQRCVSIIRRKVPGLEWQEVQYRPFDLPCYGGPAAERMERLSRVKTSQNVWPVNHEVCRGRGDLEVYYQKVIASGGEGVMLLAPESFYTPGRSDDLLKVKPYEDAEARVVGYRSGDGKHTGSLGALRVVWGDVQFYIGSGFLDKDRSWGCFKLGEKITFRYRGVTRGGLPRHATYVGPAIDK